jgi:hypothetical protein
LQSRAPFGAMLSPAPALLGVFVCSSTSMALNTPASRSDKAANKPPIPAPTMMARIYMSEDTTSIVVFFGRNVVKPHREGTASIA